MRQEVRKTKKRYHSASSFTLCLFFESICNEYLNGTKSKNERHICNISTFSKLLILNLVLGKMILKISVL